MFLKPISSVLHFQLIANSAVILCYVPTAVHIPTKLIATGFSKQTFHKEQLGVNEEEKNLLNRIHENAPSQQSKATNLANSRKVRLILLFE